MTRLVLTAHGVDPDLVKMVPIGEPQVRALALGAGRIDATTMSVGVWNRFRDRPNLKVLLSTGDFFRAAPVLNKIVVTGKETLNTKRPAIERFVAAVVNASRAFSSDSNMWVEAMAAARPEVPRNELKELSETFSESWSVNGGLDLTQVRYSIGQYYKGQDFHNVRQIDADELLDTQPLSSVLGRIGVIAGRDPSTP